MSKITQLNDRSISVEVKPDWTKFSIWVAQHSLRGHKKGFNYLQYFEGEHPIYDLIELPPGSWSILGRPEELTREQCDKVMEGYDGSLYLLLKSKGLQDKSVIILIKQ